MYKVTCEDGIQYAVKTYFTHGLDQRHRLQTEFLGLKFLWENNIRNIPEPIAAELESACGIYEFVLGTMIKADEVTDSDLGQIVGFLKSLKELTALPESRSQPQASEACFSVGAIRDSIGRRWDRLREVPRTSHVHLELHNFLSSEFAPVLETITRWCAARLQEAGLSWDSELPQMERTLSPSDFGFHNALRCDGGRIVFLDFEYFGWDDPAKMVSDFLLHPHPAMDIPEALKRRFVEDVFQAFADQANLRWRVATVYPLLGLNWCLLLLNEFVNEHLVRRLFAAEETEERSRIQRRQLDAARRMLRRMEREYEAFPYDN